MRHRELIDDGKPEPGLYQRADGVAEAGTDGDVVGQFVAHKQLRHDAAIGSVGSTPISRKLVISAAEMRLRCASAHL
jgi:hypothetical protein